MAVLPGALWPILSFYSELEANATAESREAAEVLETLRWCLGCLGGSTVNAYGRTYWMVKFNR